MMTATEAREMSRKLEPNPEEMKYLEREIQIAVKSGKYTLDLNKKISDSAERELISLGYTVESSSGGPVYNDFDSACEEWSSGIPSTTISW